MANLTVSVIVRNTPSYALRTASAPTLEGKCCGMKTPSGAYNVITAPVSDRFNAVSYFASTSAIVFSSVFIFYSSPKCSFLVVPADIDQGSPHMTRQPDIHSGQPIN